MMEQHTTHTGVSSSYYYDLSAPLFSNNNGSVLVMVTVVFSSSQTNAAVLKGLFQRTLANGSEINGLRFNPEFPIGKQCWLICSANYNLYYRNETLDANFSIQLSQDHLQDTTTLRLHPFNKVAPHRFSAIAFHLAWFFSSDIPFDPSTMGCTIDWHKGVQRHPSILKSKQGIPLPLVYVYI